MIKCLARIILKVPSALRSRDFALLHDAIEISNVWSYLTTLANLLGCVCQVGTSGIVLPCITELFSTHQFAKLIREHMEGDRMQLACKWGKELIENFPEQSLTEIVDWIDAARFEGM